MIENKNYWEEVIQSLKNQDDYKDLIKSCYYDDPIEEALNRFENSKEWIELKNVHAKYGVKLGKVLDFGAGRGIASLALAKMGYEVYAFDGNSGNNAGLNSIKQLIKKLNLKINLCKGNFDRLPFDDNFFDLVYSRQSLHHAPNITISCLEICRVLKKKSFFITVKDHVIDRIEDKKIFLKNHPLHKYTRDENAHLLSDYLNAFENSGFKILKTFKTYSSPLNYCPNNIESILLHYTKSKFLIRKDWFKIIIKKNNIISKFIKLILIFLINARNRTPGRPYSIILKKK